MYPSIEMVFNKSLSEGVVPNDRKIAHVTVIFTCKKGNVRRLGNYWPVSLTSIVCKLLEFIIRDQVMKFLNTNHLLSEDQHDFRSGRSCVTQLLEIMKIWTSMLDEGGGIHVVYLDFQKVFDSVPSAGVVLCGVKGSMVHKFWFWCTNLHLRMFWGSFFPTDYHCCWIFKLKKVTILTPNF